MNNLVDLEKKINSELGTKINSSEIKHNQIYLETDKDDFLDVILFLKTNLKSIFLVKGNNRMNPNASVKKPGIINNNAAIAIDAPEINS